MKYFLSIECNCSIDYLSPICDKGTGACFCKEEFYESEDFELTQICKDCDCEINNTVSGTNKCDQTNGDCGCKETIPTGNAIIAMMNIMDIQIATHAIA